MKPIATNERVARYSDRCLVSTSKQPNIMTTKNTQDKNNLGSTVDSTNTDNAANITDKKKGGADSKKEDTTSKTGNPAGDKNSDKQRMADKPNAQGTKKGL